MSPRRESGPPPAGTSSAGAHSTVRGERVRVEPGAVPGVEPVGDHVFGLAPADHGGDGGERRVGGGRGPSTGRPSGPVPPRPAAPRPARRRRRWRTCASPAARRSQGRPCQRHTRVPPTTGASHSAAPRCGQAPGPAAARRPAVRHATTSRPATVRPNARPGRTSRLPAITYQPPDGRACARLSAARISPGLAVGPRGSWSAQAGRLQPAQRVRARGAVWPPVARRAERGSSESGPFGWGALTRAGYARGRPSPAIRPVHSHWLRRNTRNSSRQATNVSDQHRREAQLPVQSRHLVEVHAVDACHHGRHRDDRDPGGDLPHVAVLLHGDLGEGGVDQRGEQFVERPDAAR